MFDQKTYGNDLIESAKAWEEAQSKWIQAQADGKPERTVKSLAKKVNKCAVEYQKLHNQWCDKYGFPLLKYKD